MDFSDILIQILVLFVVLFMGYFAMKVNIIDDYTCKKLSSLVVKISVPALIINSMLAETTLTSREIFILIIIAFSAYAFLFVMSLFIGKLLRLSSDEIGIYRFMTMFSNVAFMGFPVAQAIFGDEGIFYASIFNIPFNILVFSLGVFFVSEKGDAKFDYKKILNPPLISSFVGLFFFFTGIKLPSFIHLSLDMLGSITTPISMIVIGASLASVNFRSVVTNYKLYISSLLKLIVFPAIIYTVLKSLGFEGLMLGVPVVIIGMPVAANAVILSKEYDGNAVLASEGTFISTMLSIITIPFLVFLLSL